MSPKQPQLCLEYWLFAALMQPNRRTGQVSLNTGEGKSALK